MNDDGDRASAPPRVLRALVEELRASEVPPIAWDDMEARLLAQIEASPRQDSPPLVGDDRAGILIPWDDDPADVDLEDPERSGQRPGRAAVAERVVERPRAAGATGLVAVESEARTPAISGEDRVPVRRHARRWTFGAAVAAAAVAAAWLFAPQAVTSPRVAPEPVDLAAVAVEPRMGDAFDLAGLRAGDVVEASEGPVSFGRSGVLRWTLSAGGRVRVVSGVGREEPRHVIALESGALDVDVVPLDERTPKDGDALQGAERFVVEVGAARVAVHGTAFRVVRSSRGVVLEVVRGVVAVGPVAAGEGSGRLVEAPARVSFALDGSAFHVLPALADGIGRSGLTRSGTSPTAVAAGLGKGVARSAAGAHEVVVRENGDERYAGAVEDLTSGRDEGPANRVTPRPVAAKDPTDGAPQPPAGGVEARDDAATWTAERVRREVSACIARAGEASGSDARVTIASSLVVDVDAAGATRAVRFDPPIRPDLQACAQPVLRARFATGTSRLRVPLEVRLRR